jgi:cytochrome c556
MKAFAAAKAKDQEKIIEAADPLNASCTGCHRRFRDRRGADGGRCK